MKYNNEDNSSGLSHWQPAVPGDFIQPKEVHVWLASLDVAACQLEQHQQNLSADELARAKRFHYNKDRNRFIAARGMLRQLLGSYLGGHPHKLRFEYSFEGKPLIAANTGDKSLQFNLSHSGSYALFAITRNGAVGIDIERLRDDIDIHQVARQFFSPAEVNALESIDKNMQYERFFRYWTRKEAFLKAIGKGLSFPTEQFDVSLIDDSSLSPVRNAINTINESSWYGQDLLPAHGYAAAIVVKGNDCEILCRKFSVYKR